ncbi:hypothetical protein [Limosilactobacillus frumenti]|uniref:hypothetical protein n=1 Tax=Limosilactobacillus frumenti TaxID=104955 RepID=UPI00070A1634|nr:hypothetical protein [Limosilactobacillus frumenti]MBA2913659.1 hypothetical protein [Limosilactobacillus frumenti]QFG72999.1 hypothetical protein LF145_06570 [Limosilactobacillus frumenti]
MPGANDHTPVLATSAGCPRQIVRYGQLTYGLQCHMEMSPSAYQQLIQQMGADVQHHNSTSMCNLLTRLLILIVSQCIEIGLAFWTAWLSVINR